MKTRLLLRPNSDIKVFDTVFVDGYVGLLVEDLNQLDIEVGDLVSLEFNDTSLNPQYSGNQYVTSLDITNNIIELRLRWGNSGPLNPGYIRNWIRIQESTGQVDDSFVLDRTYNFDINQLEVDRKGRYIHGGLYNSGTYSNIIGGRILQTGQLDTSFNVGSGFNDFPRSILMYDDGSMIIGGRFTSYNGQTYNRIVKLNEDGSVSDLFDSGTGFDNYVYGLAKHKKGVIVVGSFTEYNGVPALGIIKLRQDGSIDTSFDYGTGLQGSDRAYSVLTTSDNKVVVGGHFTGYQGNSSNKLVRINSDGSWDSTFVVGTGPDGNVLEIKEDLDRSIIFCGGFQNYNGNPFIGICKVDESGSSDSDWSLPFNGGSSTTSIDIQSNGKYIISGSFTSYDGDSVGRIIRLNSDYTLDASFNPGTGFNAITNSKLLTNGQIVCYGQFTSFNGVSTIRLTRLDAEGISIRNKTIDFDLKEELDFPLTFSIVDIKEPEKRRSYFSKTISLPGTKNNNKILGEIFILGGDSSFNPNLKKDIICFQDGLQIFSGFMKLDQINRSNWNDISYDIKISGQLTDLFSKLVTPLGDDLKISDLDFSEYQHTLNRNSIMNSWVGNIKYQGFTYSNFEIGPSYSVTNTSFASGNFTQFDLSGTHDLEIGDVVRFEMDLPNNALVAFNESQGHHTVISTDTNSVIVNLDFRSGATNTGVLTRYRSLGQGYVYPTVNYGFPNITSLKIEDFQINFYVKEVIDKIFDYVGFHINSEFLEGDYVKRLLITGNENEFVFNGFTASQIGVFDVNNQSYNKKLVFGDVSDPDDRWNETYYYYQNGYQSDTIRFNINFEYQFSFSAQPLDPGAPHIVKLFIVRNMDVNGNIDPNWVDSGESSTGSPSSYGYNIGDQNITMVETFFNGANPPPTFNIDTKSGLYSNWTPFITLRPNEKVKFFINTFRNAGTVQDMRIRNSSITDNVIDINTALPSMTAKDLLKSLIQMHNLYVEPSRTDPRSITIEPFNDYYRLDTDAKDWTSKVDLSIDPEIQPVSANTPRNYIYKYSDDGDYQNKNYKDQYEDTYGTFEISQETEFNSNTVTTQVIFPQTVLDDRAFDSSSIIVPTLAKDINYNKIESYKTRIFYFTGIRYNPIFSIANNVGTQSTSDFFDLPMFGYAGHMDNPINATLDINFGVLSRYFYGDGYGIKVTENTLFNKYYRDYYDEITDKNTKLLTAYLRINSNDISNISFRRLYYIKDVLWRLQSISDYDPISGNSTKCEFIKVRRSSINTSFIQYNEVIDVFNPGRDNPYVSTPNSVNIGSFNEIRDSGLFPTIVVGDSNTVGSTNTIINGNDNRTTESGSNIIINGNDNSVDGSDKILISGSSQSVGTGSNNIYSFGDRNNIGLSNSNIYNFGNDNIFPDGLTNSYVFGSNVTATQSDSVYFGGNIIFSGTVSGLTNSIPHYDAIGYYEGGSFPNALVDQFQVTSGPYFRVYDRDESNGGPKSYTIGDTYSNNRINRVDSSQPFNAVIAGKNNGIGGDSYVESNIIAGGQGNYIGPDGGTTINSYIIGASNSTIDGSLGDANNSGILGSVNSNILSCTQSAIFHSNGITMSELSRAVVIARENFTPLYSDTVYLPNLDVSGDILVNGSPLNISTQSSVIGGSNNFIYGSEGAAVIGGDGNYVSYSQFSTIVGGQNNYIELGQFDTILGSLESHVYDSEFSNIVASQNSYIDTSTYSAIFGSNTVNIEGSESSTILSDFGSNILNSEKSHIFGSNNSDINSSTYSIVIGGRENHIFDADNSILLSSQYVNIATFSATPGHQTSEYRNCVILGSTFLTIGTGSSGIRDIGGNVNNYINSNSITSFSSGYSYLNNSSNSMILMSFINNIDDSYGNVLCFLQFSDINNVGESSIFQSKNLDLTDAENVFISGVATASMTGIYNSSILSPQNISATSSNGLSVFGGSNYTIDDVDNSQTIGGNTNVFKTSTNSVLIGGQLNTLTYSTNSLIIGGYNNKLRSPGADQGGSWGNSVIIGGISNNLNSCGWSIIAGGDTNTMTGFYSGMVGGAGNVLGGTYSIGNYCFQGGGSFNGIYASQSGQCRDSGMVGGIYNLIHSIQSFEGGGAANKIGYGCMQSSIIGGNNNLINNGIKNIILGGDYNTIKDGYTNTILSSYGSTSSGCNFTTIIGCQNLTATQSNTTYMDTVNIQNVLQLNPLTSDPVTASKGTIYYHDTLGPRFYDGSTWRQIDFT